jgi:hypothetical protein
MSTRSKLVLLMTNAAIAFAVFLYMISPIDLVPDFVPILGWLDDLASLSSLAALTLYTANAVSDGKLAGLLRLSRQVAQVADQPRSGAPQWSGEVPFGGQAFDPDQPLTLEQIKAL